MLRYEEMLLAEKAAIQEYINRTMEFYDNAFDIELNEYGRSNLSEQRQVLENKLIDINKQLWYIHMIDMKVF
jgi:hypothetical protein